MTAASNPAAELTEAERLAFALHEMACEDNPGHSDWTDCATTGPCRDDGDRLAARLAAGGAATDDGLRARVEAVLAKPDLSSMEMRAQIRAALNAPEETGCSICGEAHPWRRGATFQTDAAPAPTEDAAAENRRAFIETAQEIGTMLAPAVSRAADTAAEEPRTEAQIKAEALREASQKVDAYRNGATGRRPANTDLFALMLLSFAEDIEYQADRADRLSRANEEAGS